MASLIFAASYMTYTKIKTKREEKKEKKRKAYADRYSELERDRRRDAEKQVRSSATGDSQRISEPQSSPIESTEKVGRRSSSESALSNQEKADGPSAWVDEVIRERTGGDTQRPTTSEGKEAKRQSLI